MKRLFPLLATIALTLSGCVENDLGVVLIGNYAPDPSTCLAPTSVSGSPIPRGTYDIGVADTLKGNYRMTVQLMNNLPQQSAGGVMTVSNVEVVGFQIELSALPASPLGQIVAPGQPGLTSKTVSLVGGVLMPNSSVVLQVDPIGADLAGKIKALKKISAGPQAVYPTINVNIKARFRHAGDYIYSNSIDYPVDVCYYCLGQKPGTPGAPAVDPASDTPIDCPEGGVAIGTPLRPTCFPQQDQPTACCGSNGTLLCGNNVPVAKM